LVIFIVMFSFVLADSSTRRILCFSVVRLPLL